MSKRLCLALASILLLLLPGCHKPESNNSAKDSSGKSAANVLRFGHQHGGDVFLKSRGILEKQLAENGFTIKYVEFPAGPQLLEALSVGSIDIGWTGESPPIFAQAAGSSLVYVANFPSSSASGEGQAILVPKDSPIQTIQDLKGKRIAFQKASTAHNFLLQIVERAGLTYKDIHPIFLAPPDARAAFESGSIDAWVIWDPFLTIAQEKTGGRVLVTSTGIKSAGGFYLSSPTFVKEHPNILKIVLQESADSSAWAYDHPEEASALRQKATGVEAAIWMRVHAHEIRAGILPITEEIIQTQQLTADNYFKIGLLPKRVNIRDRLLTPEQYAQILPKNQDVALSKSSN